MQGGTFTISSLGGIGGTYFTPIINAPEVAILGVSRSATRPVWDGRAFAPRLMLPAVAVLRPPRGRRRRRRAVHHPPVARPGRPAAHAAVSDGGQVDVVVLGGGPGGYTAAFRAADLGLLDGPGGALRRARRRVPQRRLHPVEGAPPRRRGHHRRRGGGGARHRLRRPRDRHRPAADVHRRRGRHAHQGARRPGEAAQGARGPRHGGVHVAARARGRDAGGTETIAFAHAIIAAGSQAATIPGLPDDPRIMDSTDALRLDEVPERLLVIGGGIIGLEMATVYDALGSRITVVEMLDRLIPGCDPDLVGAARRSASGPLRGDPPEHEGRGGRRRARTACT